MSEASEAANLQGSTDEVAHAAERWRDDPDMSGERVVPRHGSTAHIQRELTLLSDATRGRQLEVDLSSACSW